MTINLASYVLGLKTLTIPLSAFSVQWSPHSGSQKSQKLFQMTTNITMSSNKEDIVTSACEVIDIQTGEILTHVNEIQELKEERAFLISLAGVLFISLVLF